MFADDDFFSLLALIVYNQALFIVSHGFKMSQDYKHQWHTVSTSAEFKNGD